MKLARDDHRKITITEPQSEVLSPKYRIRFSLHDGSCHDSPNEADISTFFATSSSVPNIAYVLSSSGLSLIVIVFCLYVVEYTGRYVNA